MNKSISQFAIGIVVSSMAVERIFLRLAMLVLVRPHDTHDVDGCILTIALLENAG